MHRPFGQTGLLAPPIVFGTSSIGNLYQAMSEETCRDIVASWFTHVDAPIWIDTAGKYGAGLALERLGRTLRELDIPPDQVVISNKLGWLRAPLTTDEPSFERGVWVGLQHDAVQDISYEGVLRCYEQGCELLAPFTPTLVSVHDPDEYLHAARDEAGREHRWEDIRGAYQALAELRADGRAKAVGVGAKDWRAIQACDRRFDLDWVMIANSFTVHSHPPELVRFIQDLQQRDVPIINSAVFHGGFLVGGNTYNYQPVNSDAPEGAALLQWRERFVALCDQHHVLPAEACAAFAMSPPGVVALALSSTRAERVETNLRLCQARMPAEFWSAMKAEGLIAADFPFV